MKSVGDILKERRLHIGENIETISSATNIPVDSLYALENEDYSCFPGEVYIRGFLLTYSEYLGLNPKEVYDIYSKHKLQEQETPYHQLYKFKKARTVVSLKTLNNKFTKKSLLIILPVIALSALFIFVPDIRNQSAAIIDGLALWWNSSSEQNQPTEASNSSGQPSLTDNSLQVVESGLIYTFKLDGVIHFPLLDPQAALTVIKVEANEVEIKLADGETMRLIPTVPRSIDIDRDGNNDYYLSIEEIIEDGALVLVTLYGDGIDLPAATANSDSQTTTVDSSSPLFFNTGQTVVESRIRPTRLLEEAAAARPFSVVIRFLNGSFLRYQTADGRKEQRFYNRGETLLLDIREAVMLWAVNSGALSLQVNNKQVSLGQNGEISVAMIQWLSNEDGSYSLQLIPAY